MGCIFALFAGIFPRLAVRVTGVVMTATWR